MDRNVAARLAKVKLDWTGCEECRLARTRTNQVWGRQVGELKANGLVLIGEAPGADEDYYGKAFVGAVGKILDEMMERAGITNATIINPVACRPPANRNPFEDELWACFGRFQRTLQILRPHVIVTMGRIPYLWLTGQELIPRFSVKNTYESEPVIRFKMGEIESWLVLTYHPGYVIRNRRRGRPIVIEHFKFALSLMEVNL